MHFLREIERFRGLDMAKMPYPIHGNPSFQNIQFGETKIVLTPMGFSIFLKQAIFKFFRSNGLDIALFDNETLFETFSPTIFCQKRVWDVLARQAF